MADTERLHQNLDVEWTPYAEFEALLTRLERIAAEDAKRWTGNAFRFCEPAYAVRGDRLDGVGAKMWGGRWNPKGLAACYGATTPQLAMAETYAVAADRYGFRPADLSPRVIFAFRATRLRVIDLTDGRIRQRLRVSRQRMAASRWRGLRTTKREGLTQAIGRAAFLAGCQGLLVPTHHSSCDFNVVAFPEAADASSRLRTIDAEKLDLSV